MEQISLTRTHVTYDPYGRLIEIRQTNGTVIIADRTCGFDNLSRSRSETKDGVNRLVRYDNIDRVKTFPLRLLLRHLCQAVSILA